MTFAKIVLTSPRLIKRVKKNNGEWCPAILGRHPLINEVAFEAREEQLDRLCDANGGAFEDAELRGLWFGLSYIWRVSNQQPVQLNRKLSESMIVSWKILPFQPNFVWAVKHF